MTNTIDWSKVLFRCSCLGKIMTEGKGSVLTDKQQERINELQSKEKRTEKQEEELSSLIAKKNAPPRLSDTCISYLKEVYVHNKYGKEPIGGAERSKYTLKGKAVEDESIMMLSRIDSAHYEKNKERFYNSYLSGEPDIIVRDAQGYPVEIKDIKSSYDYATLLANYGSQLNPLYYAQMQGYMALTGADKAEVDYCLVNMPQEVIESEKRRIFYAINPVTEEDPYYKSQIERIEWNMTFDEIPINERILRFSVERNDDFITRTYKRIDECRKWLQDFDNEFSSLNKI